jgi:hypothetical protein
MNTYYTAEKQTEQVEINRQDMIKRLLRIHTILSARRKGGVKLAKELVWDAMCIVNEQDNLDLVELHKAELNYRF